MAYENYCHGNVERGSDGRLHALVVLDWGEESAGGVTDYWFITACQQIIHRDREGYYGLSPADLNDPSLPLCSCIHGDLLESVEDH
jgi:hypothetical protein